MRRGPSWVVLVALVVGLLALALLIYVWFFSDRPNFRYIRPMPAVKVHHLAFEPGVLTRAPLEISWGELVPLPRSSDVSRI